MEVAQSHQKQDIFHRSVKTRIWTNVWLISIGVYVFFVIFFGWLNNSFTLELFSHVLAGTAALLIGSSLALSGFCYYWDFLDAKIGYRRYLGLVGYFYALVYSFSLLLVHSETYFYGFFDNFFTADFLLGLTSMTLFTYLAIISNTWAMKKLGPQRWRRHLRISYVAWVLLAIRAFALEGDIWQQWFGTLDGFPPPRLLLSLLVVVVILFRLSVEVSKRSRKSNQKSG